jgi:hypothetical protein
MTRVTGSVERRHVLAALAAYVLPAYVSDGASHQPAAGTLPGAPAVRSRDTWVMGCIRRSRQQ